MKKLKGWTKRKKFRGSRETRKACWRRGVFRKDYGYEGKSLIRRDSVLRMVKRLEREGKKGTREKKQKRKR